MTRSIVPLCTALLLATTAAAQTPPPPPGAPAGPDPFGGNLFPPELIMQSQQALGLRDEQRNAMIAEVQRVQAQSAPIQWRLTQSVERLATALQQSRVDEAAVLEMLDGILAAERELKRLQIGLLVRLKNGLTAEQQALLRARMGGRSGQRPS
ncbi:MAG: periplasmic heavy metal sensor [Candidatus Methylomirabilaceae bacterium]